MADDTVARLTDLVLAETRRPHPDEAHGIVSSVLNRMDLAGFPSDLVGVLTQKKQYSPFTPTDPNYPIATGGKRGTPEWQSAAEMVKAALSRPRAPYTHYWANSIEPSWSKALGSRSVLGSHTFGVEARKRKRGGAAPLEDPKTLTVKEPEIPRARTASSTPTPRVLIPSWAIPGSRRD